MCIRDRSTGTVYISAHFPSNSNINSVFFKPIFKRHLGYLTAICALKQVLSVRDTRALLETGSAGHDPEKLYAAFYQELSLALDCTAEVLDPDLPREELPRLALRLALRSYADKLACQRILALLAPEAPKGERRKK